MKIVKKIMIIGTVLIIGIMICSCGMKKNNSDESKDITLKSKPEIVLNERQKEILEEVGLPTEAEKLDSSQQEAIIAIDEMLTAVEKKYNRSFSYSGYVEQGPLESEHLMAYPSDGNPRTDSFEVRKTDNGYEDDYMNVAIRDDYAKYVEEIITSNLHNEHIRVFTEIYTTELTSVPENKQDYKGKVSSWKAVFLYLTDNDEIPKYVQSIQEILKNENLKYDCEVIFLKEDVIDKLTEYNYEDYLSSDYYVQKEAVEVD